MDTEAIARKLVELYNNGSPDWVNEIHATDTEWIELPFLGGPGRQGGFAELRKAAEDQVANFPDRRMKILNIVAGADQAARTNSAQALASEGVDPASIHGAALDRQASVTGAGQEAAAGTQSAINTTNTANQMVANANQLGMQVGTAGTAGAATAANTAAAGQQSVNQTNQTGVNNLTAANSYLNTGTNANSSAANIATSGRSLTALAGMPKIPCW